MTDPHGPEALDLLPELDQLQARITELTADRPDIDAAVGECLTAAGQGRRPSMLAGAAVRVLLRYDDDRLNISGPDLEYGVKLLEVALLLARADRDLEAILDSRTALAALPTPPEVAQDAPEGPVEPQNPGTGTIPPPGA